MLSEQIHRQFIDLVLSGGTYRDIAQGIAQRVNRPVTIVDRFRQVLGEGFIMGHAPVHKPFLRDAPGGDRYLNDVYRPETLSQIEGSEAVLRVVQGPAGSVEHGGGTRRNSLRHGGQPCLPAGRPPGRRADGLGRDHRVGSAAGAGEVDGPHRH